MTFTHYHAETKTLFELGACENCSGLTCLPNAVTCLNSVDELVATGITVFDGPLPPEIGFNEDLGITDCENCHGKEK